MMKATNKIFTFVLLGLLTLAAPLSYAADTGKNASKEVENKSEELMPFQDAWQFLKENTNEYSKFTNAFGQNAADIVSNVIDCGERRCNLDTSSCLVKESEGWFRDYVNAVTTTMTLGLGNDFTWTTNYEYICVPKDKVADKIKDGWEEVEKGHANLKSSSSKLFENAKERKNKVEECYSAKRAKGEFKKYCVQVIDKKIEVHAANEKNHGCEVVPVRWYNNRKCTFCSLLGVVYKAGDNITSISHRQFALSFAMLIIVGLAIWTAMKTLNFVSSMTKQDAAKFITELLKQSYKFAIAYFALIYYHDIFKFIITPLLQAGLAFGTDFVSVVSLDERFHVKGMAALKELGDALPSDYHRNLKNNFYNFEIYANLENFAYNVNLQYALLQTIGGSLMCLGKQYVLWRLGGEGWSLGLGFGCIVYGMAFSIFGFLLCLAFVFYIFDAIVQIGIVGALLPFLVASWPFKITSKYTSAGFKMLLNSIFTFMMMGMVVKISMALINKAVELNTEGGVAAAGGSGLIALVDAIDTLDEAKLKIMVNVLSVGFLLFMFANIMGFLLLARVSELVNRFASGGMKASAPSIATMGASTVKGMYMKTTAPIRKEAGEAFDKAVHNVAKKGANAVVGLATLRPVRNWAHNRFSKGAPSEEENRRNLDNARRGVFGTGETPPTPRPDTPSPSTPVTGGGGSVVTPQTTPVIGGGQTPTQQTGTPLPRQPVQQPEGQNPVPPRPESGEETNTPPVIGSRPSKDDLDGLE